MKRLYTLFARKTGERHWLRVGYCIGRKQRMVERYQSALLANALGYYEGYELRIRPVTDTTSEEPQVTLEALRAGDYA